MKRLIAPLAAALLIGLAGCGAAESDASDGGNSASTEGTSQSGTESEESTGPQNVAFGQPITFQADEDTQLQVTIGAPADYDAAQADFPPEKGKFVVVEGQASLLKGIAGNVSEDEFILVDAQGNRYEPAIASMEISGSFIHLLTADGEVATGQIIYDVPADATGFTVEYQPTDSNSQPLGLAATWK
ncbi:DUF4352 domain-containing protein [Saccharopolyspora sp. K220]|uniref:DUF4352 domain-containing protein n=1 Tax=Saccharopolyspora soli TaxID=2926618 RepID=UPI001F57826B|nr:DUF4352 domain-containing protein [Saccharopolyspora soli]MCI2423499.1 DUF4352 domain-containing protein [Saccharopolyspora soli]